MAETVYYVDTDVVGGAGDGSSWANAYASLNTAEQAQDANITGGNAVAFNCRGATSADTTAVSVSGWTTDSDSYVRIYTETANRHDGKVATSKYRLSLTSATHLQIYENFVRVEGIQFLMSASSANVIVEVSAIDVGDSDIRIDSCIVKGQGGTTHAYAGIKVGDADATVTIWNTLVYNIAQVTNSGSCGIQVLNCTTTNIYGCTVMGGYRALSVAAGTVNAKNVFAGNSSNEDFYRSGGTLAKTTCASEDLSADDTSGSDETVSGTCLTEIAINTSTFVDVTIDGGEDFHLVAGSPLIGVGTTLTDDPPGSTALAVDIDGQARTVPWDVGCDEYVAAGRTTRNSRSHPLGIRSGTALPMGQTVWG